MNPLHILLLPCLLAVSITGSTNDYSSQGRSGGGYGLLRPYPSYSGGYNGGYNGYSGGYGGYGSGYGGYNPGYGGSGIGYPGQGYPGNYPGSYGGYPGYSGGPYGGNRPYNRPGYDGRPGYNYQSGYPGNRPGYNQYRPGFDRPYQTNGYFDGVRDGYDNFGLLGRKVSEIKKDDA